LLTNTNSLKLYLPKVDYLILDSCFNLKELELGHSDHLEWNKAPGSELSKFKLSLRNAKVSATGLKSFEDFGRDTVWKTRAAQGDAHAVMDTVMAKMH